MINFSGFTRSNRLGQLARAPLKLLPDGLILPIPQGKLRGKLWITGSLTHGCSLGSYELSKQRAFQSLLFRGSVLFDIGANVGFYSLLGSEIVQADGHIYAFEPVPRNLHLLRKHVELNRKRNVTIFGTALSDATGRARFSCPTFDSGSFCETGELEVATMPLDNLAASEHLRPPSLLKIVVEGAELMVLQGARNLMGKYRPAILLATHGAEVHRGCCNLLRDFGYTIRGLEGRAPEATDELLATAGRASK